MTYQQLLESWRAHSRQAVRLPRRRSRRAWVLVMYAGLAANMAEIVSISLKNKQSLLLALVVWLIVLLATYVWIRLTCWAIPVIATPPLSLTAPHLPVDERQRAVGDRAYRRAYQIGILLFILSAVAFYVLQDELPALLQSIAGLGLAPGLLCNTAILLLSLPVATLAWTEPDDPLAGTEKAGQASRLPAS